MKKPVPVFDAKLFKAFWQEDGNASEEAPAWAQWRTKIRGSFPSPYRQKPDPLAKELAEAIRKLDDLKPERGGHGFLGIGPTPPKGPDYATAAKAELRQHTESVNQVVDESIKLFHGLPIWNHPLVMPNVIPPANIAAIIAATLADVYSPNIIEGDYSWNVELAELESAAMVGNLIGWGIAESEEDEGAGGLFTFGGTGCYFYGLKYALTRVLGEASRNFGVRTDAKLLVSQQGHYCMKNSTDWVGLGMDNIITIKTDLKTNAMDIVALEQAMKKLHARGIPIASIVCTMGSTDTNAMDDVAAVRQLIDAYPNPEGYGRALLYCDAVIGWSWLAFCNYDFGVNPLGFTAEVLETIKNNYAMIKEVKHADAIGCDFHKVGWAPYNCSLFMYQSRNEFTQLLKRPTSSYLPPHTTYNPGDYTLEVSRSGNYAMAGWATLKFLGHEGFQAILGGILEMQLYLRHLLEHEETMVCVNADDHCLVTLYRVYPRGVNAKKQYYQELIDPNFQDQLIEHNQLQANIGEKMWEWFRDGKMHHQHYAPYINYSTGFRPTAYNRDESDENAMVFALKSFPMNVNIDRASMDTVILMSLAARDELLA